MDAGVFQPHDAGVEEYLRCAEALRTQVDGRPVWEPVRALGRPLVVLDLFLFLRVQGQIALLLLDLPDDFTLGGGVEHVPRSPQLQREMLGDVTASDVRAHHGVRQGKALVHRDHVSHAIAGVQHHPGRAAAGVQGEDRLRGHEESRRAERLEKYLRRLLPVLPRIQRGLGEQDWVLLGDYLHFRVKVAPDKLHVIPVLNDPMRHWILQCQDATELLSLCPNEDVSFRGTGHDPSVLWPADVRWEGALHRLVPREASFHDSRSIVDDNGLVRYHLHIVAVNHGCTTALWNSSVKPTPA
mmetsp:Transcript_52227/g.137920  ORF Transcript_52227/g.137920 Transcript_52227/m.137920 type:complete len:298 (-) Transcript_52227:40-933(-)